ncbi:MAG TPA: NAD(P)H-dependent oxidoreductase subunit E [Candidatus Deferrimicrobium sp.]|nr:NAD(P)H-dependent oxidoreductase subunit E [Candidatus Deferrimicrobium sp.]
MTELREIINDVDEVTDRVVTKYGLKPSALIMILQDVQKHYRYLPKTALDEVSRKMKLPVAQVYGVATFFRAFSLEPKGKYHVCVCTGTACHVRQATVIVEKFERDLGIKSGGTTSDLNFSLETVNCLGACALGPLVTVNDVYHGHMTVDRADRLMDGMRKGKVSKEDAEVTA